MVIGARRGFTLIELIIAMVLLAIGLMALTGALAVALRETGSARVQHAALRRAEAVADSLVLVGAAGAGALRRPGLAVWWTPEPCVLGQCVRVRAAAADDTLSLLARVSP
jgi:prepilin-type N-terminal cleavage/methylation domain-containing protein